METKLMRIAEQARENETMKFSTLAYLLNVETLKQCHHELPKGKATGIKGVTKEEYEQNLHENVANLVENMKLKRYRPVPVRRAYIPKGNDKRPLGIPEHEDKMVQRGVAKILNAIYEQDFLDCSFGFRPERNCHDALKILNFYIEKRKVSYVVDADIKGFFNNVDHSWLMKFLEHRISDPNFLRIIARFLKGGYMEEGKKYKTDLGTPQGGVVSPILANVYLHYVLDLWFEKRVKRECRGEAYLVRYADDFVCCFQHHDDAQIFYQELQRRLRKFNLEIATEKTKIIPFGRFAEENSRRNGGEKPQTFDFLGFTHYCSKGKKGNFRVKHKTSRKKLTAKVKQCDKWIKENRHAKGMNEIKARLDRSLKGYYNYYCITDNSDSVHQFLDEVVRRFFKWMNRRSQRNSMTWEKYLLYLKRNPFPQPKIKVNIYELRPHLSYIL